MGRSEQDSDPQSQLALRLPTELEKGSLREVGRGEAGWKAGTIVLSMVGSWTLIA